jgi:hypothetical protein
MSCLTYICYAGFCALAQNTIVPSLAIIDTLPLGLCFIDIVCFDNAGILLCLLWLHRYSASLSYLPLGLLCLLGLPLGLFCLLGHFAS